MQLCDKALKHGAGDAVAPWSTFSSTGQDTGKVLVTYVLDLEFKIPV